MKGAWSGTPSGHLTFLGIFHTFSMYINLREDLDIDTPSDVVKVLEAHEAGLINPI